MSEILKGAVAITDIATGTRSAPFLLANVSKRNEFAKIGKPIQVGVWQNGEIRPASSSFSHSFWPKLIELAADVHEQNVGICRWQQDTLILQTTRPILTGQKLYLWFGEDLLLHGLGIPPYLSPANIRVNSYVCHNCRQEFTAPNPLKIHLALNCGALPIDILWTRLSSQNQNNTISRHSFHLPPPPTMGTIFPFTISSNIRAPYFIPPQESPSPPPPSSLLSSSSLSTMRMSSSPSHSHSHLHPGMTRSPGENKTLTEQHAHLESIVSNMGKAKNGHVCLYCGKLYSRKYGLKIHIRTHTGYKPLHCRICHRPFGDPSNLNKHVRLHSDGNTPYRCDFCGKVLVRRRDLDRHIRSRHTNLANGNGNRNFSLPINRVPNKSAITATASSNVNGSS